MAIVQSRMITLIEYITALRADQDEFLKQLRIILDQQEIPTAYKISEILNLANVLLGKAPKMEYLMEQMHFKVFRRRNDNAQAYKQRKRQGPDQGHKQPDPDQTRAMQSALAKRLGAIADRQAQAQAKEPPQQDSTPIQPQGPMATALPDGVVIKRAPNAWQDVDVDADPFE